MQELKKHKDTPESSISLLDYKTKKIRLSIDLNREFTYKSQYTEKKTREMFESFKRSLIVEYSSRKRLTGSDLKDISLKLDDFLYLLVKKGYIYNLAKVMDIYSGKSEPGAPIFHSSSYNKL